MLLQLFDFPNINPIAIDIGIIKIRWYAISYICGILLSWFLILKIIKIKNVEISNKNISDLVSNCMIGVIVVGGDTSNMEQVAKKKLTGSKSKKKRDKLLKEI